MSKSKPGWKPGDHVVVTSSDYLHILKPSKVYRVEGSAGLFRGLITLEYEPGRYYADRFREPTPLELMRYEQSLEGNLESRIINASKRPFSGELSGGVSHMLPPEFGENVHDRIERLEQENSRLRLLLLEIKSLSELR